MEKGAREGKIVASVLNADAGRLADVCAGLEDAGLDGIQWDVMDGHYVPNLTVGPSVIGACRKATRLPFEAHLMIEGAERVLSEYVDAGCETVIVHAEACTHLHRALQTIHDLGAAAGVALNPATPLDAVTGVLDLCDLVLVMTVNPGFGGQSYIATMEPKITEMRALIEDTGRAIALEVDGGIAPDTISGPARAGADRFVVGSALYKGGGPAEAVANLRSNLPSSKATL
ncbi:MAG TPA: ribulose-phosphate 3-epimerase [Actinomycetota bacterium]|nr:ribulose-phosphate 3-epimerase [Actinomycetota bacterium]